MTGGGAPERGSRLPSLWEGLSCPTSKRVGKVVVILLLCKVRSLRKETLAYFCDVAVQCCEGYVDCVNGTVAEKGFNDRG